MKSTTPVPNTPLHSTPRKRPLFPYGHAEIPVQPQQPTNTSSLSKYNGSVSVKVQWASETRERTLNKDLESLGKCLCMELTNKLQELRGRTPNFVNNYWSLHSRTLIKNVTHSALKNGLVVCDLHPKNNSRASHLRS